MPMASGLSRLTFFLVLGATGLALTPSPPMPSTAVESNDKVREEGGLSPASETPPELADLRRELDRILASSGVRGGKWGILAVSLDRGDTLLAVNPDDPMIPASNQKLLTTAAALHALGPDFRYETFLLADGSLSQGILEGDLVLYGTGDPSLSRKFYRSESAPLDTLAQRVVDAGVREVSGDLVVDGSYFSGPDLHPEWDPRDLNDPFAAPVSAVSYNENLLTVRVEAADAPQVPPLIETMPPGSGIPVVNTAVTTAPGTRSRVWLFRETPRDPVGIEGEIPLGGRDVWRELPVPDPLSFTGRELLLALEARGIRVNGQVRIVRDPKQSILPPNQARGNPEASAPRILGRLTSPPLLDILTVVNKESNNLLAETVAKTLGRITLGEGSFQGGTEAVGRFLTRDVGIASDQFQIRDGSGLSFGNHVSARALIDLLTFMAQSPEWEDFWSTLPIAGVRRELGRMGGSPASRNLRAKTGTMHGVSALSGMVRTRSGERVLFSILSNEVSSEYRAKRVEDQLGIRLASLNRPSVGGPATAVTSDPSSSGSR